MVEALKSMNKKYLLIIASIFLLLFLIIIVVAITRSCSRPGSNYTKVENKMVDAARKYYKKNTDARPSEGESSSISVAALAEGKYMKPLSKYLKDSACTGDVKIYNNGGQYLIIPNLECTDYKTTHIVDKIKKDNLVEHSIPAKAEVNQDNNENNTDIVSENDYTSGLYDINGTYVFMGKNPNNYISIAGVKWRIIDIDENNIMRVLKINSENRSARWDSKYNIELKKSVGINDYKNSGILEKLNEEYGKFKDSNKVHLAPMDVCIAKRNNDSLGISKDVDCAEKLEKQYISLVNSGDYARASLDEHCTSITSGSCNNYNYLSYLLYQTWTTNAMSDNTYQAIAINGGVAKGFDAKESLKYHWVVALNGNELYTSGSGTEKDPYVLVKKSK